jgi:hypothetical protein
VKVPFARPCIWVLATEIFLGGGPLSGTTLAISWPQVGSVGASATLSTEVHDPGPAQTPTQESFDPTAARIKYLHDRLRIAPAQEPLWANVAQVMRDNAAAVMPLLRERIRIAKNGNAIDYLDAYEKLGEAQLNGIRKFIVAFQTLYNSLSDDQKKIADAIFRLGPLSMVGGIPEMPAQLAVLAPYYSYPPPYPYYPPYPTYPPYAAYAYYPPYGPWFWGPPLRLGGHFLFFHERHHLFGFRRHGPFGMIRRR